MLLCSFERCWQHVGMWSHCHVPAPNKPSLPCGFAYSRRRLLFWFPCRNTVYSLSCCLHSRYPSFLLNLLLNYPFLMLVAVIHTALSFNPEGLFFYPLANNFIYEKRKDTILCLSKRPFQNDLVIKAHRTGFRKIIQLALLCGPSHKQ